MLWYGIIPARIKRVTAQYPLYRHPTSLDRAVFINRLVAIMRAARIKPTCVRRQSARDRILISPYEQQQNILRKIEKINLKIPQSGLIWVVMVNAHVYNQFSNKSALISRSAIAKQISLKPAWTIPLRA